VQTFPKELQNFKNIFLSSYGDISPEKIFAMISSALQWLYLPPIDSADVIHCHDDGAMRIECYANLKSSGAIEYRYMVGVYPSGSKKPLVLITCETSTFLELSDPGKFALGVFLPKGHRTLDVATEYGHWNVFLKKAVEVIESLLADGLSPTA